MSDWDVQLVSAGSLPMQGALLGPEGTFADTRICSNVVLLRGGGRTVLIDTAAGQLDSEWVLVDAVEAVHGDEPSAERLGLALRKAGLLALRRAARQVPHQLLVRIW